MLAGNHATSSEVGLWPGDLDLAPRKVFEGSVSSERAEDLASSAVVL